MESEQEISAEDTIDPFVLKRATDWGDLVENKVLMKDKLLKAVDPVTSNQALVASVDVALPKASLPRVTALWFSAATLGIHIRFPQTQLHLFCYELYYSFYWTCFITLLSVLELVSPFIEIPRCDFAAKQPIAAVHHFAFPITMTAVCFVSVTLQLIDVIIYFNCAPIIDFRNDRTKLLADNTHSWVGSCGICCVICMLDFIIYFGTNGNSPRLSRMLFPVILISRQENARLIIEGFFRVFRQTLFIIGLLLLIINFMGLLGLFLFVNMSRSVGVDDFIRFRNAFMTCLHCFASRPSVLFTVNPYIQQSNAPPYFFVVLTLMADILVGTLIVAVANRYSLCIVYVSFMLIC